MRKAFFSGLVVAAALLATAAPAQVVTDSCDASTAATNLFPFSVAQDTTSFTRDSYFTFFTAITGKDAGYAFAVASPTIVEVSVTHSQHDVNRRVSGMVTAATCPPDVAGFDPPVSGFALSSPSTGTGNKITWREFLTPGSYMLTFGSRLIAQSNFVIEASGTALSGTAADQSVSGARTVTLTGNSYTDTVDTRATNGANAAFDLTPFASGNGPDGPTILYSFTPTTTDTYNLSATISGSAGAGTDTVIIGWSTPVGSVVPTNETAPDVVVFKDDLGAGGEFVSLLTLNAGTDYTFAVSGWFNIMDYGDMTFGVHRSAAGISDWTSF